MMTSLLTSKKTFALLAATLVAGPITAAGPTIGQTTVSSPDGQVQVDIDIVNGLPEWKVRFDQQPVITDSRLKLCYGKEYKRPVKVAMEEVAVSEHDSIWQPTWGQFANIRNHYRELRCRLKNPEDASQSVGLWLRVYDNAVAIRYLPENKERPFCDRTEFNFSGDFTFWAANGEHPNHGPVKISAWDRAPIQAPMTLEGGQQLYCAVLEAAIYDQYPFLIRPTAAEYGFESRNNPAKYTSAESAGGSSWRVLLLGRSAGDLIVNQTLNNLNPPVQIEDVSWIKPGLALWDWRAWGARTADGFTYNLDMESWKRFIDFAASTQHVRYLLLDANWYGPEFDPNEDPTTSRDHLVQQNEQGRVIRKPAPDDWQNPIDVPALIKYGREKNVGIILYINDHARKKFDFENTLATYQAWGAAGIKFGFMATKGNAKVHETRRIIKLCAQHNLICDFHDGPIPGSGDSRTYPNYLTREFCHAQSDGKRAFSPDTFCKSMFVNGLTGSIDMNNGLYAIQGAEVSRPRIFQKVNTTVVGETARTVICYSALSIIPDIPEAYQAKSDLFQFLDAMPMSWDETRVLNSRIGDHITVARRSQDRWLIGSACDEKGAELTIDFSFLPAGQTFQANVFEDSPDANFQTNPESYRISKRTVDADDRMTIKLAPGGGHCVIVEPLPKTELQE